MRQLLDETFYRPLPKDPTSDYSKELNGLISEFPLPERTTIMDLVPPSPKPGVFYMLPKIHKLREKIPNGVSDWVNHAIEHHMKVPGRPIISCINTLTEHLSAYIDSFLQPLLPKVNSYIKDTTQFLQRVQNIGPLPSNCLLVTLDVTALYTNIPHKDGIEACKVFSFTH